MSDENIFDDISSDDGSSLPSDFGDAVNGKVRTAIDRVVPSQDALGAPDGEIALPFDQSQLEWGALGMAYLDLPSVFWTGINAVPTSTRQTIGSWLAHGNNTTNAWKAGEAVYPSRIRASKIAQEGRKVLANSDFGADWKEVGTYRDTLEGVSGIKVYGTHDVVLEDVSDPWTFIIAQALSAFGAPKMADLETDLAPNEFVEFLHYYFDLTRKTKGRYITGVHLKPRAGVPESSIFRSAKNLLHREFTFDTLIGNNDLHEYGLYWLAFMKLGISERSAVSDLIELHRQAGLSLEKEIKYIGAWRLLQAKLDAQLESEWGEDPFEDERLEQIEDPKIQASQYSNFMAKVVNEATRLSEHNRVGRSTDPITDRKSKEWMSMFNQNLSGYAYEVLKPLADACVERKEKFRTVHYIGEGSLDVVGCCLEYAHAVIAYDPGTGIYINWQNEASSSKHHVELKAHFDPGVLRDGDYVLDLRARAESGAGGVRWANFIGNEANLVRLTSWLRGKPGVWGHCRAFLPMQSNGPMKPQKLIAYYGFGRTSDFEYLNSMEGLGDAKYGPLLARKPFSYPPSKLHRVYQLIQFRGPMAQVSAAKRLAGLVIGRAKAIQRAENARTQFILTGAALRPGLMVKSRASFSIARFVNGRLKIAFLQRVGEEMEMAPDEEYLVKGVEDMFGSAEEGEPENPPPEDVLRSEVKGEGSV